MKSDCGTISHESTQVINCKWLRMALFLTSINYKYCKLQTLTTSRGRCFFIFYITVNDNIWAELFEAWLALTIRLPIGYGMSANHASSNSALVGNDNRSTNKSVSEKHLSINIELKTKFLLQLAF